MTDEAKPEPSVETRERYWIVEWRFPASNGKPAWAWEPVERTPYAIKEMAEAYPVRSFYEYRISEFVRQAGAASQDRTHDCKGVLCPKCQTIIMGHGCCDSK